MNGFRTFLVVKTGSMQLVSEAAEDGSRTTSYHGGPYREERLRDWAMETFKDQDGDPSVTEESTLEDIAREIRRDGWLLYEGIWPAPPQAEKSKMHRIAEAFEGDLEACADSIAEACKGVGARVMAKTMISEVTGNGAVITITVGPAPRKCRKEDIKAMVAERPGLAKILKIMVETTGAYVSEIAEKSGLPEDDVREIFTFVEQTCQAGNFENPIES